MKRNRVYTVVLSRDVLPGTAGNVTFAINNVNRRALLKSIWMDLHIIRTDPLPTALLNLHVQNTQIYSLAVQSLLPRGPFAQIFEDIVPAVAGLLSGRQLVLYEPGQMKFDSFEVGNDLQFQFAYANTDLLNTYSYFANITVELEDTEVIGK